MDCSYPTKYSDRRGVELSELRNDGRNLSVRLRDVSFSGCDFDGLKADADCGAELLSKFTLRRGYLCDCDLDCEIPIPVVFGDETFVGILRMHLELGAPARNGGLEREELSLSLAAKDHVYRSAGTSGWFEDELLSLQSIFPPAAYLKACISCAYSDYSPYGHGLFGGMTCFRNFKQEYAKVKTKEELFPILDKADIVQETYLCPEFDKRLPRTGYRG
jgi:Family of unknown function (DUF6304)